MVKVSQSGRQGRNGSQMLPAVYAALLLTPLLQALSRKQGVLQIVLQSLGP